MSLAGRLINFVNSRSAKRFESATKDPLRVQREKLLGLMQKNADTEYGRRYGFADIDETTRDRPARRRVLAFDQHDGTIGMIEQLDDRVGGYDGCMRSWHGRLTDRA